MTCYYNDPKATAATLRDGWLLTGDMAMADEEGFIFLVDRKKDVIITGGENLYPVQIENFLSAHPDVKDVAVIGLQTSAWAKSQRRSSRYNPATPARRRASTLSVCNCRATSARVGSFSPQCRATPPARLKSRCCASATAATCWWRRRICPDFRPRFGKNGKYLKKPLVIPSLIWYDNTR